MATLRAEPGPRGGAGCWKEVLEDRARDAFYPRSIPGDVPATGAILGASCLLAGYRPRAGLGIFVPIVGLTR